MLNTYKKSALFLLKFFGAYFLLFFLYSTYLNYSQSRHPNFVCSPLTTKVASQTVALLNAFSYTAKDLQHEQELAVKLMIDDVYVVRIIEGCNAVSIMILFIAFVIAFSGPMKATIGYVLFGSLFIYVLNIFRIALFTILLYEYPSQRAIWHNLVFPAIIYGVTFLLWIIWIHKFSYRKK